MWITDFSDMRLARSGSDCCYTYTTLRNVPKKMKDKDSCAYQFTRRAYERCCSEAYDEFRVYREQQMAVKGSAVDKHFIFDIAVKVLLPRLVRQSGQLHSAAGLCFDLNGVCSSNSGLGYVFGLPEGHWPNDKIANVVTPIPSHTMSMTSESRGRRVSTLYLTADDCGGQNQN